MCIYLKDFADYEKKIFDKEIFRLMVHFFLVHTSTLLMVCIRHQHSWMLIVTVIGLLDVVFEVYIRLE